MKNKQIIGIVVTGLVIIAVGVTGVVSNVITQKLLQSATEEKSESIWSDILDMGAEGTISVPKNDFIGVLRIEGEIGASQNSYFSTATAYNHSKNMAFVNQMEQSDFNKGILLYIDSPGGAVYQTDELYQKLMEYKEKTNRPIWAYYASQACSGGYYVSMAADEIRANRNNWTGSIGVIISLTNVKGLYDKLGIKEIDITSGKNKAMGAMGAELTEEQKDILQSLVDEAYDQFVEIVARGRQMDTGKVRTLADGRIYSAKQAAENGLIDSVDTLENTKSAFIGQLGVSQDIEFYEPESDIVSNFLSGFFEKAETFLPKTEIDLADDIVKNDGNGVLKYYAK